MSKGKLTKFIIWFIVVLLITIAVIWLWLASAINAEGKRTSQVRFVIEDGQGVNAIALQLKDQGIISTERLFTMGVVFESSSASLKAGEYLIPANASIKDIISLFREGETDNQITIKILPGQKLEDIAEEVANQSNISKEDFLLASSVTDIKELFPEATFPVLEDKPVTQNLEGYILPETDYYYNDATAEDVIFRSLTNLENKLTKEDREAITAQGKTIFEILTMASIVERESTEYDRAGVAGVFWNRLEIGMPLQSDATVNYATDAGNAQPTYEELQVDSPYNTYKHAGLPPGPICNPSVDSIRATIYYEESDYYYFLHPQDGSKQTIYGRTLEEHNNNRIIYLP